MEELGTAIALYGCWGRFLNALRPSNQLDRQSHAWRNNCKPILEEIVSRIEAYRKDPKWRDSQDRKLSFLPSTFEARISLFPLQPNFASSGKPEDQQCAEFSKEISDLLEDVIKSGITYHRELRMIQAGVLNNLTSSEQVKIASCFAKLSNTDQPSLIDCLRVEIAHGLLVKAEEGIRRTPALSEISEPLLARWSNSPCEEIRMRGCIGLKSVSWLP